MTWSLIIKSSLALLLPSGYTAELFQNHSLIIQSFKICVIILSFTMHWQKQSVVCFTPLAANVEA